MAKIITGVRTEDGISKIDFNALANKPSAKDIGAVPDSGGTILGDLYIGNFDVEDNYDIYVRRKVNDNIKSSRITWNDGDSFEIRTSSGATASDAKVFNSISLNPDSTTFGKPVAISSGGTGATNAADARNNLGITSENIGAASKIHTHDPVDIFGAYADADGNQGINISSFPTIPIEKGGTGAKTAEDARENLGVAAKTHFHSPSDIMVTSAPQLGGGTSDDVFPIKAIPLIPITKGGTGATNQSDALANLGGVEIVDLTNNEDPKYSTYDMDEFIKDGETKIYKTRNEFVDGDNGERILIGTKGTPRYYNATTFARALIISYSTGSNYGSQLALSAGGHMWYRRLNNGDLGSWSRVTTNNLISGTAYDYAETLPEAGNKGRIFYKKVGS